LRKREKKIHLAGSNEESRTAGDGLQLRLAGQQPLQRQIDARVLVVFLCAVLVAAELLAGFVLAPGPSSPTMAQGAGAAPRAWSAAATRRGTALRARSTAAARRSRVGASLATRERWGFGKKFGCLPILQIDLLEWVFYPQPPVAVVLTGYHHRARPVGRRNCTRFSRGKPGR